MTHPLSRMTIPAKIHEAASTADMTGIRIGKVTAYTAGSITVAISGTDTLVNATYLSSYFPTIGDNVAVLRYDATWIVLGGFGQTQSRYIPVTASVAAGETTNSTSYVDLTTPGPSVTVNIGSSGQAQVALSARILVGTVGGTDGLAGYQITDPTKTVTQYGDGFALEVSNTDTTHDTLMHVSCVLLHTGLTPGLNTFKMTYRSGNGANVTFSSRLISVTPY